MYDCIIIGKGPAGISCALYLKRANINCLVIGKDNGSLEKAHMIENYYGQEEKISGKDLIEKGIKQAENLEIPVLTKEVLSIYFNDENPNTYIVKTNKGIYEARTILLATGANRNKPNIKGIKEFEGKGISYCATCDAFFYRNKKVGILGSGDYALSELEELLPIVSEATLLTNGNEAREIRSGEIQTIETKIREFKGEEKINSVVFEDDSKIDLDGIFIAEGVASSTDFAKKLGAMTDGRYIKVDDEQKTNIPGIFAAGDCTGGILQISKSVYDGTKAAFSIISYIKEKKEEK